MYRQLPWSTAMRIWSSYLRSRPVGFAKIFDGTRFKGALSLYESRIQRRQPLQAVSFLSETVRGDAAKFRQYNAWGPLDFRFNDRWSHAHVYAQQPKEVRRCQCNQTACLVLHQGPGCMGV